MASKNETTSEDEKNAEGEGGENPLKKIYFAVEDQYYAAMDFLDQKLRIPVYKFFVEPIEVNGVPSFPFAVLMLMMLAISAAWLLMAPQTADVSISLKSASTGGAVGGAQVTLLIDGSEFGQATSGDDGTASFGGVPLGKPASVIVKADNFKTYSRDLDPFTADRKAQTIELEAAAPRENPKFTLSIVDEGGMFLSGAKVTSRYPDGIAIGAPITSDSLGKVKISLPKMEPFLVKVEKTGYIPVVDKVFDPSELVSGQVTLRIGTEPCTGSNCPAGGNVSKKSKLNFVVKNQSGSLVNAVIIVTSTTGREIDRQNTRMGSAEITADYGTAFTYTVTASGADADRYYLYASPEPVEADRDYMMFSVVLENKPASSYGLIRIGVNDEAGKQVNGAKVRLYNEYRNVFLIENSTKNGAVSFEVPAGSDAYYATAYADGFFPEQAMGLSAPAIANVTLKRILPGSAGSAEILVLDYLGSKPVSGATLTMRNADGTFSGYPSSKTDADGKATLKNIALEREYFVTAELSPKTGQSAVFEASDVSPPRITIKLDATSGTIIFTALDVLTGSPVEATATAYAAGMQNTSCTTVTSMQNTCSLSVLAEAPVRLYVNAAGYEPFNSAPIALATSESKAVSASLLPSALKDQFYVGFAGLADSSGRNATMVDKGQQYDAKFLVHFPDNYSGLGGGIFIRIGREGFESGDATDSKESFVLMRDGSSATPEPHFSHTYNPSPSCSVDESHSYNEEGYYKWVYYKFANTAGTSEVSVRAFVKPTAQSAEKMELSFRGWLDTSGGTYVHFPSDPDFGNLWRSSSKDWCYPASNKAVYSTATGRTTCTGEACISLDFSDGNASYGSLFMGTVGTVFTANALITLFKPLESPRIKISSPDGQIAIYQYFISTDSGNTPGDGAGKNEVTVQIYPFASHGNLTANLLPILPATAGQFYVALMEGDSEKVRATGYVTITGQGNMSIGVDPATMAAGEEDDLVARLMETSTGKPVETATVSITETSGSPFAGHPPSSIVGGAPDDPSAGNEGVYTFESLKPVARGEFNVTGEHADFLTVSKAVVVQANDFLNVTPSSIEACNDERSISLANNIDLNASVMLTSNCTIMTAYQYSQEPYVFGVSPVWVDATSSVAYDAYTSTYSFVLPNKRLGLFTVRPADWEVSCSVSFSAEAGDGSVSHRTILYKNCGKGAFDKFLSIAPPVVENSEATGRACNSPATYTIANNLSGAGTVNMSLRGEDLALDLNGVLYQLNTTYYFDLAKGSSSQVLIRPTRNNSELTLNVHASTAEGLTADVAATLKNCADFYDPEAPKISLVDYSPRSGDASEGLSVKLYAFSDKTAVCHIDTIDQKPESMRYVFPQIDLLHEMELSLDNLDGVPELRQGSNTYYIGCCNPGDKGGLCAAQEDNYKLTFNYTKKADNPNCKPVGELCSTQADCCDPYICNGGACMVDANLPPLPVPPTPPAPIPMPDGPCTNDDGCPSGKCIDGECVCDPDKDSPVNGCGGAKPVCVKKGDKAEDYDCEQCDPAKNSPEEKDGHPAKYNEFCSTGGKERTCDEEYNKCMDIDPVCKESDNKVDDKYYGIGEGAWFNKYCEDNTNDPALQFCVGSSCIQCVSEKNNDDGTNKYCSDNMPEKSFCVNNKCCADGECVEIYQTCGDSGAVCDENFEHCDSGRCVPNENDRMITLTFENDRATLTGAAGTERDGKGNLIVPLQVSTVLPFAVVPLKVVNKGTVDIRITFDSPDTAAECYGIYSASSNHFFITIPDPNNIDRCGDKGIVLYGANSGFTDIQLKTKEATITIGVSVGSGNQQLPFKISPRDVDTGHLAIGAGVFETKYNVFVPFEGIAGALSLAQFDKSGELGEDYSKSKVFSNILAQYLVNMDVEGSGCSMSVVYGLSGTTCPLSSISSLITISPPFPANTQGPTISLGDFDPSKLAIETSKEKNHDYIRRKFDLAVAEWNNLLASLENNDLSIDMSSWLSVDSGGSKSAYVPAIEGNTLRILKVQPVVDSNTGKISFEEPVDFTAYYEYPSDSSATTTPPQNYPGFPNGDYVPGTYWPWLKGGYPYPGQKHYTGFTADASFQASYDRENSFTSGSCSTEGCIAKGSTDEFCNPASMATERNPWLCCPATHLSRNGKCVPGGTQDSCVLSQSGLVIFAESDGSLAAAKASVVRQAATGGLKAGHFVKATEKSQTIKNKDTRDNFLPDERFSLTGTSVGSSEELKACFSGVGCEDAGGCDSANYYSDGTSAMKPYYLLNPGRRCFQFKYEDTGGMTENTTVNNCVECSAPFADLTYINNWRAVSWAAIFGVHTDSASKTEFTTVCTDGKEFDTGSCSEYRKDKSGIDEGDWDSDFISGSCTHAGPWVTSAGGNTCKLDPNAGKSGSEINAHLYGYPIDNDKFTVSCESDTLNDCLGWDDKSDDYRNDHYEEFEGTKQCV